MQTPREKALRFVVAAVLLVGALHFVSTRREHPALPADADHTGRQTNDACAPCHGTGAPAALSPSHPPKDDCLHCHRAG